MSQALLDLYEITGDAEWKQQAEALIKAFGQVITGNPRAYTHMVHTLLRLTNVAPAAKATQQQYELVTLQEAMETKAYVKVSASEPEREGNRLTVTAVLDIAQGWHVNANPASLDFLIPISVDVREDSGKAEAKPVYPDARAMTTPLGEIKVYEGRVSIPVKVKVTLPDGTENLRLLVRAQACKDAACLAPSDWVIPVKLK
jgi:DsbC/DsbD-like thiol-disulfide interchange protein